jgi:hypothetical protein
MKHPNCKRYFGFLASLVAFLFLVTLPIIAQTNLPNPKNRIILESFRDTSDGAFDMSQFLIDFNGLLPVPFLITEPAVGYGAGLALVHFQRQKKKFGRHVPPNITAIGGMLTQNGTWAGAVGHFHVFGADKIRYLGGVGKPYVNINFFGINNNYLEQNPAQINLDAWATVHRVQVRLGESGFFAGMSYAWFRTQNSVDTIANKPLVNHILSKLNTTSTLSMLQPIFSFDNRDNIFTPTKGVNTGVSLTYNATWLGANDNFSRLNPYFLGYKPVLAKWYSAWRFDAAYTIGEAPLYALPFIMLRGVPAMRYQGQNTMVAETEWRYNFYKRWSVIGFTGTGKAFESVNEINTAQWVYNYGTGFRYKIANAFGLHTGVDFAWSNSTDFAFYVVMGSSWFK